MNKFSTMNDCDMHENLLHNSRRCRLLIYNRDFSALRHLEFQQSSYFALMTEESIITWINFENIKSYKTKGPKYRD